MRALCLALVLTLPTSTLHQSITPTSESPLSARGAFFAIVVPDIDDSAQWYRDKLGLKTTLPLSRQGRFAVTTLEGNGLIVELIQNQDAQSVGRKGEPAVHGMFKAGVIVDDFDKTVALLKSRGVEIVAGPFPTRPDMRANVLIKDNAGNLIQFFGK